MGWLASWQERVKKGFDIRDPKEPPEKPEPRCAVNLELKLTLSGDSLIAMVEQASAETSEAGAADSKTGGGDG